MPPFLIVVSLSLGSVTASGVQGSRKHILRSEAGLPLQKTNEGIPKTIHHVYRYKPDAGAWPKNLDGRSIWQDCYNQSHQVFKEPEFTYMFWDDGKAAELMKTHCSEFTDAYSQVSQDIVRADLVRLCFLYVHGGIYMDLDYEPRQNFYTDLHSSKVNLVQSPYSGEVEVVQNSLMASPPGHPFLLKALKIATDKKHHQQQDPVFAAGPHLFSDANASTDPEVHILPCNSFQRATHPHNMDRRKNCKLLLPSDATDPEIKGIHWGTQMWMKGDGNTDSNDLYAKFRTFPTKS